MGMDPAIKERLSERFGEQIRFDEPMSEHTSLEVGGPADIFAVPNTRDELLKLIACSEENSIPCLVIGDGTNLLVRDGGIRGMVIVLTACLKDIVLVDEDARGVRVRAMAGARMHTLCSFAIDNGLGGMNFAIGIPGTVGGGIMMNAGTALGCMENVLHSITVLLPGGKTAVYEKAQLDFSYRKLSFKAGP